MNCEYVNGYPFYTFTADESLIDKIYNEVQNINYQPVLGDNKNIPVNIGYVMDSENNRTCFYNKELYDFLDTCVEPIYKKHFKHATKHVINELWVTKSAFGAASNFHYHAGSVFSGLLYLQDCKTPTTFMFDDPFSKLWEHFTVCNHQTITYNSESKKGKLLVWPSSLNHKINVHKEKETRYSIAFNTFWNGVLCNDFTGALKISTTPAQNLENITYSY